MAKENIGKLHAVVEELMTKRQTYLEGIAEIDAAFESLGVRPAAFNKRPTRVGRPPKAASPATTATMAPTAKKRGRPAGSKNSPAKGRPRGSTSGYNVTASDLVLATIQKHGGGASGADLSKAWKSAGRPGEPYNTLGELIRTRQIVRERAEGQRGSTYKMAK